MQRDDVGIGRVLSELDRGVGEQSEFGHSAGCYVVACWITAPPAPSLNGIEEGFNLDIERRWLFKVDRVTGVGRNSKAGIWKCGFQHQVGFETGRVFVAHDQQDRHHHSREPVTQVVQ